MSDPDILKIAHDTPRPNKMKKTEEVQELSSASVSPDRWGDDETEEINGTGAEHKQGEVTSSRDETDPLKKRKVYPPKPSSRNKSRAIMTKKKIVLTLDDFDFIIATLNDALLEIVEKQEAKQEEMYEKLKVKF
jgi:hypothetical protein